MIENREPLHLSEQASAHVKRDAVSNLVRSPYIQQLLRVAENSTDQQNPNRDKH